MTNMKGLKHHRLLSPCIGGFFKKELWMLDGIKMSLSSGVGELSGQNLLLPHTCLPKSGQQSRPTYSDPEVLLEYSSLE